MEIRILSSEDVEAFRALRLLALETNPEAFGSTYEREFNFPIERFKERLSTESGNFVVGAFVDDTLVCNASFVREQGVKNMHKGSIVAMYCDEAFRGKGVAKAVVQFLIDKVRRIDAIVKVDLTVVNENLRAKSFYESLGFKVYGTEPKSIFDGERYLDEDLMTLEFD